MKKENKIDILSIQKRLEIIIPEYKDSLRKSNDDDYQGSFHLFEFDEPLLKALTNTKYSAEHLDYEYFMGLIHSIVVHEEILDPKNIANKISSYVESTIDDLNWVAVFPFTFNILYTSPLKDKSSNHIKIGKFNISTDPLEFSEIYNTLQSRFGVENLSKTDYQHQSTQGIKSIKNCPLIMLNVHGSEDSAFNSSKLKVNYLISLLEVYAVLEDAKGPGWASNEITTRQLFLVNKKTGNIVRSSSNKPIRMKIHPNDDFYNSLNDEFILFSNMVFDHNDKLFTRLKSALNFFSRGLNGTDRVLGFISYVIAIEAIFSRDKNTPIRITLAEYIALLCYPVEERVEIYKTIKAIYDARSALVHAGKIEIDDKLIKQAETISAKTILYAFRLYSSLNSSENRGIEEQFFNHLRDLRLGIYK